MFGRILRQYDRLFPAMGLIVVTKTWDKNKKNRYTPTYPSVGYKGVYIIWTRLRDTLETIKSRLSQFSFLNAI